MGMTYAYGPADETEALRALRRYVELGGNFLDTAEVYGPYENEELIGRFLREVPRGKIVVATKFGFRIGPEGITGVDGSPENARRVCHASLKRLGTDYIDLYYQHRVDPDVPIEETVGAMGALVREGKARAIGLSEAAPETLRRAAKVHPIAALQSEYSLWSRDVETKATWLPSGLHCTSPQSPRQAMSSQRLDRCWSGGICSRTSCGFGPLTSITTR